MARWVVLVQASTEGGIEDASEEAARFEGTQEQARARLYEIACTHRPRSGLRQKRREVYRIGDGDTYYACIKGVVSTFRVTYQLAELVWSTGPEPKRP
ncbi:hypothetical protein [Streptomyces sp. NPDC058307]|uniref:hypothetical protein n=1 Tax=Streptomyces sp. NPDC058307 TaxID=3346439 RepID=UPI0036E8D590